MFKEYIRNIVKEQIDDIRLENTLKQPLPKTYWEEYFKAQLKHTETAVKERDKEIYRLKEIIENLEGKLISKSNLLSEQREENEKLKKVIEQLKEYREIDFKASLQSGFQSEELKQENEQLKEKTKWLQNDKDVLLKQISEQNEEILKLKQENEQLKNLSCTIVVGNDGKLDSLFNQKLKSENEELQYKVDEYYNKFLSEGIKKEKEQQLTRELKKENKTLKQKMCIIKGIINVQHKRTYTNDNLMTTIKLIEDNLKES